jgi:hypothetical protein
MNTFIKSVLLVLITCAGRTQTANAWNVSTTDAVYESSLTGDDVAADITYDNDDIPLTPCSGRPAPVFVRPSDYNSILCAGSDLNLVADYFEPQEGLSLQWQSSLNSTTWSDIPGATSPDYTATSLTDTIHYRVFLTCSHSPLTRLTPFQTIDVRQNYTAVATLSSDHADNVTLVGDVVNFTVSNDANLPDPLYLWAANGVLYEDEGNTLSYTATDTGKIAIEVVLWGEHCTVQDNAFANLTVRDPKEWYVLQDSSDPVCGGTYIPYLVYDELPAGYTISYDMAINDTLGDQFSESEYGYETFYVRRDSSFRADFTISITRSTGYSYTETKTINQAVRPAMVPTLTMSAPASICYGSPATFSFTGTDLGTAPTYQWYRNQVLIPGATGTSYTVPDASRYMEELLVVYAENVAGECLVERPFYRTGARFKAINLPDPNTTYGTASGSTKLCEGDEVTFTSKSAALSGASFAWQRDGVAIDGENSSSYITDQPGAITGTVTTQEGCTRTATSARVINERPTATISENSPASAGSGNAPLGSSFCTGSFTTLYANTNLVSPTYRWQLNGANKGTAVSQKASVGGDYTLTVTKNSCAATSAPYPVTEKISDATVTADGTTSFCLPGSVKLNAIDNPDYTYQWYKSSAAITGETNYSYTTGTSGSYRVAVKNGSCPEKKSAAKAVVATATPAATIAFLTKKPTYWTLRGYPTTAGHTYQWYKDGAILTDSTNRDMVVTANGFYSVVVSKAGCTDESDPYQVKGLPVSSGSRTVATIAEEAVINIFPNPSTGIFNIGSEEPVNLVVKDVQGRVVLEVKNASSIDLSNQAAGMYIMSITDAEGKLLQVERVVKQ